MALSPSSSHPWPYRFASLTPSQVAERRNLLDHYGHIAQLSALLPLSLILLYRIAGAISSRLSAPSSQPDPGERSKARSPLKTPSAISRWLSKPLLPGWSETRLQYLVAGLWFPWLLYLCVVDTGDDYLHLTKRLSQIASSQLPLHYLLAVRAPLSPLSALFPPSSTPVHATLNPYHRLHARLLLALFVLHGALYLNFYVQSSLLAKRIRDCDVQLGITALGLFVAMVASSYSAARRKIGVKTWRVVHVVLAGLVLTVAWLHVQYLRPYAYEAAAVYVVNIGARQLTTKTAPKRGE